MEMRRIWLALAVAALVIASTITAFKLSGRRLAAIGREYVVLMVAPRVDDPYYADVFEDVVEFQANVAETMDGRGRVLFIVDRHTWNSLDEACREKLRECRVWGSVYDIWVRDYAPVCVQGRLYMFKYRPSYLDEQEAEWIQNSFKEFLDKHGVEYTTVDLVLDGGNFVYDGEGKLIVTERVLKDNPDMTRDEIISTLKAIPGVDEVAMIPEEPGDLTGHADGMVLWLSPKKLLVNRYEEPFRSRLLKILEEAFPEVEVVEVPYRPSNETWKGFPSACGDYVNTLVTSWAVYVPVYGSPLDEEALEVFRENTDKEVIPIDASAVCFMGGSLHCLTWDVPPKPQGSSAIRADSTQIKPSTETSPGLVDRPGLEPGTSALQAQRPSSLDHRPTKVVRPRRS